MKLRSLASIQKIGKDDINWHNVDKNIYDEKIDISYIFRLFGIPFFVWKKDLDTKHNLENEVSFNKRSGFNRG